MPWFMNMYCILRQKQQILQETPNNDDAGLIEFFSIQKLNAF